MQLSIEMSVEDKNYDITYMKTFHLFTFSGHMSLQVPITAFAELIFDDLLNAVTLMVQCRCNKN